MIIVFFCFQAETSVESYAPSSGSCAQWVEKHFTVIVKAGKKYVGRYVPTPFTGFCRRGGVRPSVRYYFQQSALLIGGTNNKKLNGMIDDSRYPVGVQRHTYASQVCALERKRNAFKNFFYRNGSKQKAGTGLFPFFCYNIEFCSRGPAIPPSVRACLFFFLFSYTLTPPPTVKPNCTDLRTLQACIVRAIIVFTSPRYGTDLYRYNGRQYKVFIVIILGKGHLTVANSCAERCGLGRKPYV